MSNSKEIIRTKDFIMTPNELTGMQDRLISAVQTKIRLNTEIEYVDFTLSEIGNIMNIKITNYERFRDLFQAVKTLELKKEEGQRVTLSTLFSEITWDKQYGFIRFNFSNLAKENFIKIKDKPYASIDVKIASFKSDYAVKILQLVSLLKNRRKKQETYNIEIFRELLNITDSYANISNLRLRVLDPAKKEINENTDLEIDYTLNKYGRRVRSITLKVLKYVKRDTSLPVNNTVGKSQRMIELCREYKFTSDQTLEFIQKYPAELFFKVSYKIKSLRGTGEEVRNPHGYFWSNYHKKLAEERDEVTEAVENLKLNFKK